MEYRNYKIETNEEVRKICNYDNIGVLYLRLSKEDIDKINKGDDSESIKNQHLLLTNYAIEHGIRIIDEYIDDDFSGMFDEERPQFNRLIKDAKTSKFNTIICKTQSRFTRNMEHVEKYLHNEFQELGIRFIGVFDGVDTSVKGNKKSRQINGLVNEWYIEDLSENIRGTFKEKMKDGQSLHSFAPYGYFKDPNDKHKWIVDDYAAKVVKRIFELCIAGYGVDLISQKLTAEKIPTPSVYKKNLGMKHHIVRDRYCSIGVWSTTTIKRTLANESYLGHLIQGKETTVSYKNKKRIYVPQNEWIIVNNHHEAIIDEETFLAARKCMRQRKKRTKDGNYQSHIFSGKVKCLSCKGTMSKGSGRLSGSSDYLICQLYKKSKGELCSRHSIKYELLISYVEEEIKCIIKADLSNEEHLNEIKNKISNWSNDSNRIDVLKKSIKSSKIETQKIQESLLQLYIDKSSGLITESEFVVIKQGLSEKSKSANNEMELMQSELIELESTCTKNNLNSLVEKYSELEYLDYEAVNDFIDYIEVGELSEDGEREIVIHWNFYLKESNSSI